MELQIRNLSKTYSNGVHALKDITLTIPPGMYGLLGPNGAGKSTLMRTIATLQAPDEGSIRLGDIDVLRQKERVRETLGYLPQEFGVYPHSTAERLLEHFVDAHHGVEGHLLSDLIGHLVEVDNQPLARHVTESRLDDLARGLDRLVLEAPDPGPVDVGQGLAADDEGARVEGEAVQRGGERGEAGHLALVDREPLAAVVPVQHGQAVGAGADELGCSPVRLRPQHRDVIRRGQ